MIWARWSLLVTLLLAAPAGMATTAEDGLRVFNEGKFRSARDIWMVLSNNGDAKANYYLSLMYAQGKGVKVSPPLAMEFLAAAAKGGYDIAQFNLGNHYNQGKWVVEDPLKAAYWWRQAGSKGMARAQHNLATLYLLGRGVERDLQLAEHWYKRALRNGSEPSAKSLEALRREMAQAPPVVANDQPAERPRVAVEAKPEPSQTKRVEVVAPAVVEVPPSGVDKAPEPVADVVPTSRVQHDPIALNEKWIRNQRPDHFTLQVLVSQYADVAGGLAEKYRLNRQVALYRFRKHGQLLYGVGYGRYPTKEAAKSAVAELPAELQRLKPWARSFADIQQLLITVR